NVFVLLALLHIVPLLGLHGSAGAASHPAPFQLSILWSLLIAAVWLLLSFWRAAQLLSSAIRLRGLVKRAIVVPSDATMQTLLEVRTEAGRVSRSAELC